MPEPLDLEADYYDHIDGEIIGPMPYDDGEKMYALLKERMTPENFRIVIDGLAAHDGKTITWSR